jgi:hypothetical protein
VRAATARPLPPELVGWLLTYDTEFPSPVVDLTSLRLGTGHPAEPPDRP